MGITDVDILLLAAGKGTRLGSLTDKIPKPLVTVGGEALIVRHLKSLAGQGARHVFINTHYLGATLIEALGDGSRFGLNISYSQEETLLENGRSNTKTAPIA